MRLVGPVGRLSLRVRLVAGFAAAMLVVLAGAGTFVYLQVRAALDHELNSELALTGSRLSAQIDQTGKLAGLSDLFSGERYQVFDSAGTVLAQSPYPSARPLLSPADVAAALEGPIWRDSGRVLLEDSEATRVYGVALKPGAGGSAAVVAVAASRDQRDAALREVLFQLSVAGLVTLLLAAFVGDRLARAALRPVERYRRQAIEVTQGASGVRLDVPPDRDDEITRLGHSLNQMLEALEGALEHERRFVNDASHELRTPLTLIGTRVQLARRRSRTIAEHEAVLEEITVDIERISRLADQLLEMGVADGDASASEVTDLALVARTQAERHGALVTSDGLGSPAVTLQVLTGGRTPVAVDHVRLERVVVNLLDNAVKHGAPPITVAVDRLGDVARLTVTDHGAGMDPATLAAAPDRFVRAPEARSRAGSGLGLALVKATVLTAGGELRLCCGGRHERFGERFPVECDHTEGTVVTVLLPFAGAPPRDEAP
ncbi:MAG: ATP-binding protein [Nocardioidaceae bacterium]